MGKPDEGTVVMEPVENGWLVLCWEEPEDDEMECVEDECQQGEEEEGGYDPSAAFAESLGRDNSAPEHKMVTHLHIHDHGLEPRRFVFEKTEDMNAFVAEKTLAFAEKRAARAKAIAERRAAAKAEAEG